MLVSEFDKYLRMFVFNFVIIFKKIVLIFEIYGKIDASLAACTIEDSQAEKGV